MGSGFDDLDFSDDDFGMDGFGNDNGGFGNEGFGNDGGFDNNGFNNNGFGDNNMGADSGFGDTPLNGDESGNDFGNSLNNMQPTESDQRTSLKQYSWIMVAAGVVLVIIVIIIASSISKKKNAQPDNSNQQQQVTTQANDMNANQILETTQNSNNTQVNNSQPQVVISSNTDNDFEWLEIDDLADIQFSGTTDLTFTITSIKHRARRVDTNNNLVVETVLLGSLSGMSGTYEIHVPYDKGVKLSVGMNFTAHVQLGTYQGKTVVGNISY